MVKSACLTNSFTCPGPPAMGYVEPWVIMDLCLWGSANGLLPVWHQAIVCLTENLLYDWNRKLHNEKLGLPKMKIFWQRIYCMTEIGIYAMKRPSKNENLVDFSYFSRRTGCLLSRLIRRQNQIIAPINAGNMMVLIESHTLVKPPFWLMTWKAQTNVTLHCLGIILRMCPANERQRYNVTSFLTG